MQKYKQMGRMTAVLFGLLALLLVMPAASAADGTDDYGYYWLSSDDRYTKWIDTTSIVVAHEAQTNHGKVATEIDAWTKTGYSYEGAKETIAAYSDDGMQAIIPDPSKLSYSLALVSINPQNRELQYMEERFYDAKGDLLWQKKTPGRVKEINSQQFDEPFYDAIVDYVFGMGEADRAAATDRWIVLWEDVTLEGIRTLAQEDTTTMRMKGNQLMGWQWITTKDKNGNLLDIKLQKVADNLVEGTERIIKLQYWARGYKGFEDATSELDGQFHMITPRSNEAKGLAVLRYYVKTHPEWVNRYSIED